MMNHDERDVRIKEHTLDLLASRTPKSLRGMERCKLTYPTEEHRVLFGSVFEASGDNLLLSGRTGTGKTTLAYIIALENALRLYNTVGASSSSAVAWYTAYELFLKQREAMREGSERQFLSSVCDAQVFVLDDFARSYNSDFEKHALFHIINSRLERGLQTIITTNAPITSFVEMDEAFADRITAYFRAFNFGFTSYRQLEVSKRDR